jgi:hypothetical protein
MTKTSTITFATLRRLLEKLGYRQLPVKKGHVFHQSEEREIYFRPYGDRELVFARDLVKTRSFLDAWNQLDAADFDAYLESTTKPA